MLTGCDPWVAGGSWILLGKKICICYTAVYVYEISECSVSAVEIFGNPKGVKNSAGFFSWSEQYVWVWKGQTMNQALKWKNCRCSQLLAPGYARLMCQCDSAPQQGAGVPGTPSWGRMGDTCPWWVDIWRDPRVGPDTPFLGKGFAKLWLVFLGMCW